MWTAIIIGAFIGVLIAILGNRANAPIVYDEEVSYFKQDIPTLILELTTEKARISSVLKSVPTDDFDALVAKVATEVYPKALDMYEFVKDETIFNEKLNYLIHAEATKVKKAHKEILK